jgi:hypothetical protein
MVLLIHWWTDFALAELQPSVVYAPPNSAWTNPVNLPVRSASCGPNMKHVMLALGLVPSMDCV